MQQRIVLWGRETRLSRKVERLVDWSGGFWERRYSAEPVLDDEALVGQLRYVLGSSIVAAEDGLSSSGLGSAPV